MKRVRCPKCDNFITFDETKYPEGQSLVFVCEECKKEFGIRLGKTKLDATRREEVLDEQANQDELGSVVVVENVFGFKQVLPLVAGDNYVGRRNKGSEVQVPIETADPSLDRKHCVIHAKRNKDGETIYTLRDNHSVTGTFLMNELLGAKERIRMEDGAIITLGATTLILRAAGSETE
ncbi:MAG: FHA domain-containing protein [Phocaeicola sp.]